MNAGLQPQYPTVWWIDVILGGIIALGVVIQIIVSLTAGRRARAKAKADFDEEHARWEERNQEALALEAAGNFDLMPYVPREPVFTMQRLTADEPAPVGGISAVVAAFALLVAGIVTIVMCVPFNSRYFNFYIEKGTLTQIVPTVSYSENGSSADFIVALAGDPKRYSISDPRVRTLKGQQVTMICTVGWNNQAADSWSCALRDYEGSTR